MNPTTPRNSRGTISLVALCFVTVIGIALGSYLTLCSRAMTLSNRSYQAGVAQQLAEFGLEEGLRAFNKNDWSNWASNPSNMTSGAWTLDATNKRASRTITFNAGKLGQNVTATVKIRIDNYNAAQLDAQYSSTATYQTNDLVGYNGVWYRSVKNSNSGNAPANALSYPDLTYWAPAPIPWSWNGYTTYSQYDVVNYNGTWYRCHTSYPTGYLHDGSILPTNSGYWNSIAAISLNWSSGINYSRGTMLFDLGLWYYCITTHTSSATITPSNTTYWAPILTSTGAVATPSANTYSVGNSFLVGDYIYRSTNNTWYRCVADHTYSGGNYSDTSKWVASVPYISWAYRSGVTYSYNDVVFYSGTAGVAGTWYRCKAATTLTAPITGTPSPDWGNALTVTWGWASSNRIYNLGEVVYYSGTSRWYRCTLAHTSTTALPLAPGSPAGAAYWSNSPLFSTAWDSNRQYGVNDTVSYRGVWYRCLVANNNSKPTPSNTNWASAANSSNYWNATANYSNTSYASYGGVWYKCTADNSGQSPNNTSYWTTTWTHAAGVTTGAPVIYAEASVAITNSPPIRTQLRAAINPATLFPNALAASMTIQTSAAGTIDSYDSTTDSATGPYPSGFSAVVAAGNTGSPAISLASTTVQGYLAAPPASTSPYAPLASSGGSLKNPDGSITSGNMNLDFTRISRSPNIPQFDTVPQGPDGLASTWGTNPQSLLLPLGLSATTNIGTPGATTPSRYYYNSSLTLSFSPPTVLNINGPVVLYIPGNLVLDGNGTTNGRINITGTGSAEIHLSGALRVNIGSDGINNTTHDPRKLVIICDTASASAQNYSDGTVPFYGVIYMPYTTSSSGLTFDSSSTVQIYGAVSAKKIIYSVDANIHYDTSLRYATIPGVDQPYAVTDWRILPQPEQATMP